MFYSSTSLHTIPHILTYAQGLHRQEEGDHRAHLFCSSFEGYTGRVLSTSLLLVASAHTKDVSLLNANTGIFVVNAHAFIRSYRTHTLVSVPTT